MSCLPSNIDICYIRLFEKVFLILTKTGTDDVMLKLHKSYVDFCSLSAQLTEWRNFGEVIFLQCSDPSRPNVVHGNIDDVKYGCSLQA